MKKLNNIPGEIELKKLFNSIEIEKTKSDFTLSVMEKIAKERIAVVKPKYIIPRFYYLLIIPILFVLGLFLFLTDWFSDIKFESIYVNITYVDTWLVNFLENCKNLFSPAVISISAASIMLYIIFLYTNIADYIEDLQ